MKERSLQVLKSLVFFLGVCAATANFFWAKGFITLWTFLFVLSFFPSRTFIIALQNVLSFLALSTSICGVGLAYLPVLPGYLLYPVWLGIFGYAWTRWRSPRTESSHENCLWPSQIQVIYFVLLWGIGSVIALSFLSVLFQKSFDSSWGTGLTWASLAILLAYPRSITQTIPRSEIQGWKWLTPFFIGAVLVFHHFHYRSLQTVLDTSNAEQDSSRSIAEKAIQSGYESLAIDAILQQTEHLFQKEGWVATVQYFRSQWKYIDKETLALAFLRFPALKNNVFLFTTCYGCSPILDEDEMAVDCAVSTETLTYWIVTSQSRLIRLGTEGAECVYRGSSTPIAFDYDSGSGCAAILNASNTIEIVQGNRSVATIPLSTDRIWKEIAFHPKGTSFWVLDGNGRIDAYTWDSQRAQSRNIGEIYPPLWMEPDVARAFYPAEHDGVFYVLDRANGIHRRGNPPLPPGSPLEKELLDYYNPERQVAAKLGFWKPQSSLIMLEQTGRVLFFPILNASLAEASIERIASATAPEPPLIDSLLQYDPKQSTWYRALETVAVLSLPEAQTLIKLQRNGTLQAITMPQRFHVLFVHPKWFRWKITPLQPPKSHQTPKS